MKAEPLSINVIRKIADSLRSLLKLNIDEKIDIIKVLEHDFGDLITIEIVDYCDMKKEYAKYIPTTATLKIREDVYDDAYNGVARHRFTLAHELGHIIFHNKDFEFARDDEEVKIYCDPEWQVNTFARHFLCPIDGVLENNVIGSANKYGVSHEVAKIQLKGTQNK